MIAEFKSGCVLLYPANQVGSPILDQIANVINNAGVQPILPHQTIFTGGDLSRGVLKLIESADFVIADITGINPNVMYETGFAHALKKPVLLIAQDGTPIPVNLAREIYVTYDSEQPDNLLKYVNWWINRHQREKAA